jgi:hypothetical protein
MDPINHPRGRSAAGKNRWMTTARFKENILGADTIPKSILVASCARSVSRGLFAVIIAGLGIDNRNSINATGISARRANSLS